MNVGDFVDSNHPSYQKFKFHGLIVRKRGSSVWVMWLMGEASSRGNKGDPHVVYSRGYTTVENIKHLVQCGFHSTGIVGPRHPRRNPWGDEFGMKL